MGLRRLVLSAVGLPIHFLGYVPFSGGVYYPLHQWWVKATQPKVQTPLLHYYTAVVFVERETGTTSETRSDYNMTDAALRAVEVLYSQARQDDIQVRPADGLIFYQNKPIGVLHEVFTEYRD